jgi:hypothetical protein
VPNTAHILQFTLCELWSRIYTKHLQLQIFRIRHTTLRTCAAIRDMSTIQCALYCKHGAKYSAHSSVNAVWTVVPAIISVITATHIQAAIFNWTYLRCYWRYLDNSMSFILKTWCQIQCSSSSLSSLNCGPGHIQCKYSSAYSGFNLQMNVSPPLLEIYRQFCERYTANLVPIQRTSSRLRYVNCGPGHIQCNFSTAYSGFNIQMNVSALL